MIYLALIALAQIALLLWLPWHLAGLLLLVYVLRWSDRAEYTGHANWPAWRALWCWRLFTPVAEIMTPALSAASGASIIIVSPCSTPSTMLWSVGLASSLDGAAPQPLYMLPTHIFWVPLVRDFFLWSGAVSHTEGNVAALLQQGKSVCFAAPSAPSEPSAGDAEDQVPIALPSDWLLEIAIREHIRMQIVTLQGEDETYAQWPHLMGGFYVRRVRSLFVRSLRVYWGTKIEAASYAPSVAALKTALSAAIARNSITSCGDKLLKAF